MVVAVAVAAATTVENRVSGAARVVFTVEMQIPTTRVQTCIAPVCVHCEPSDGRAVAAVVHSVGFESPAAMGPVQTAAAAVVVYFS